LTCGKTPDASSTAAAAAGSSASACKGIGSGILTFRSMSSPSSNCTLSFSASISAEILQYLKLDILVPASLLERTVWNAHPAKLLQQKKKA
jgi:hypothetical protein